MKVPDKVLYVLPHTLEDALFCTLVAQTHSMYGRWKADRIPEEVVVCREEYEFFVKIAFPLAKLVRDVKSCQLETFDAVVVFDRERAFSIAKITKQQAVPAYGILCGSAPQMMIPTIGQALVRDPVKIVLAQRSAMDFRGTEYQYPFSEYLHVFEKVFHGAHFVEIKSDTPLDEAYREISSSSFVVGVVGGFTLLAASMMKPLLEIYPEKTLFYREWASKWSSLFYKVIAAEVEQVPPDFLAMTLDKFIGEMVQKGAGKWRSMMPPVYTAREEEPSIQTAQ